MANRAMTETLNVQTELIMPGHTNPMGNLMGGNLLSWMDVCSGISAIKLSRNIAVTASLDDVSFKLPIKVGDIVTLRSFVTRTFNTSMEVICEVFIKNIHNNEEVKSHEAFFTFVALDSFGRPTHTDEVFPETDREKELYEQALERREFRLVKAGKIQLSETTVLKNKLI
ncbi:MAG: acyl-CoA thioesterase [Sphingobacteriales bacterium]|jgi:acyl-CoA hydrolase|nr:MAG: acyl-CoA thioesterase [Sphingobacteriales bacterium]